MTEYLNDIFIHNYDTLSKFTLENQVIITNSIHFIIITSAFMYTWNHKKNIIDFIVSIMIQLFVNTALTYFRTSSNTNIHGFIYF